MAPPEDDGEPMREVMSVARGNADDDDDASVTLGGYDSGEEARAALLPKIKRAKGIKAGEEEDPLAEVGAEPKKGLVGKNNVEKIEDTHGRVVEEEFLSFLKGEPSLKEEAQRMIDFGRATLWIRFSDLAESNLKLATLISDQYYRFLPRLERATERYFHFLTGTPSTPETLSSLYHVSFYGLPYLDRIRDLRTDRIGQLISFTGTVTRTSETRPELLVGIFKCERCGKPCEDPIEQDFKYTEPPRCVCSVANSSWVLDQNHSIFVDWQKVRVQENATEIPAGSMPRSMEIICRYETVEVAKPGDRCVFTGSLIVIPDVSKLRAPGDPPGLSGGRVEGRSKTFEDQGVSGLHSLGVRDLSYRLAFLACSVQPCDGSDMTTDQALEAGEATRDQVRRRVRETFTSDQLQEIERIALQPKLVDKLKRSFAPAIYGHSDIKLGVLLLLFSGVHKKTPEGINLRGDINVCIVGDPSTAKSQFLRYVCSFDSRAVYTSGKASTAAGLTASVMRDPETGEFCIEAGALMLADNGVCCIDEFDKMDDIDQVAIHEAMEQQTISITKAGIQATLNARTSVLAAANPIHGRYDRSKTLKANLTVGPAIMSRFDLFFVVLDECDEINDRAIADHILEVHRARVRGNASNESNGTIQEDAEITQKVFFTKEQMRRYVRYARTIDPQISPEVQPLLVDYYVRLRQGDHGVASNKQAYRITVRQLEALVRLSEAMARLHLDDMIRPKYVEAAYKLLKTSIVQVESESLVINADMSAVPADEGDDGELEDSQFGGEGPTTTIVRQDDYDEISNLIEEYVKEREQASQDDDDFFGVPQTDVIEYVLEHLDGVDEHNLQQERARVNTLLDKIVRSYTFLEEAPIPLGFDFQEDIPLEERRILRMRSQM